MQIDTTACICTDIAFTIGIITSVQIALPVRLGEKTTDDVHSNYILMKLLQSFRSVPKLPFLHLLLVLLLGQFSHLIMEVV